MKEVDFAWLLTWILRNLPDLTLYLGVVTIQALGVWWILRGPAANASRRVRTTIVTLALASFAVLSFGFLLHFVRVSRHLPLWLNAWGRGSIIAWALISVLLVLAFGATQALPKARPEHSPARRNFLRAAHIALFAAPAAAVGYGVFIERLDLRLREQSIAIPGLHPDLNGLRIVQLTDIHLGAFLAEREVKRAVAIANETRAHIALVTGDLISFQGDPLDACLNRLARLTAEAGIFGCLGNHEIYAGTEDYTTEAGARLGMRFLRDAAAPLRFGDATLNLAGVDYQHLRAPYLVGTEKLVRPDALNVLLSHNPDVFPIAARQGWQCTISGHTHGGQVRVEILHQNLSVARFFTHYVDGLYREGPSSIFVSRGIGTIGVPARLGAPPEVALLRLCRT
jgi:predicted MPP superfamily phosphohydrolase